MQSMPDMAVLMKIAQSSEGRKLLAILQNNPAADLGTIASKAAAGDLEGAKQMLRAVLASQEAQVLLNQLEKQL